MSYWILIIPLILIAAIGVVKTMPRERTSLRDDASFAESIMIIVGTFLIAGGYAGKAVVAAIALLIVTAIADAVTGGRVQSGIDTAVAVATGQDLPTRPSAECDFAKRLGERGNRISEQWMPATICRTDDWLGFYAPRGTTPEVRYRDASDVVLSGIPVDSFVWIRNSQELGNGGPDIWRIDVTPGRNGFDAASIDSVELAIRARRN